MNLYLQFARENPHISGDVILDRYIIYVIWISFGHLQLPTFMMVGFNIHDFYSFYPLVGCSTIGNISNVQ